MTFLSGAGNSNYDGAWPAGIYSPPAGPGGTNASVGVSSSRAYVSRIVMSRSLLITKICFALTVAAGSNDGVDAGIFSPDGVTLLGSAGSTLNKLNAGVPSVQTLTLLAPVQLNAGQVYYSAIAFSAVGTTAASVVMTNVVSPLGQLMGATLPNISQSFQAGAFPLAAPLVSAGAITSAPILGLLV